jgi:hypothetical protein
MSMDGGSESTLPSLPAEPVHPALEDLANFSPEELQRFLEAVKAATDNGVRSTMDSLTVTVMTAIE